MSDMIQRRNKQLVSFEKLKHFAKVYSSPVLLYSAHQSNLLIQKLNYLLTVLQRLQLFPLCG